jgi:hypothetical protein
MRKKNKYYLFLVIPIFVALFKEIPAKATSSDAITLESISAVSSTVLTGQDIVMQVQVAVPAGYSWDPNVSALGGKMTVLFCPVNRYSEISGIGSCSFTGTNSNLYNLTTISTASVSTAGSFDFISFTISGRLNSGEINDFKLYRIRIPAANLPDRSELHTYLRGQNYAQELGSDRTDVLVPTFLNGDVSVVTSLPTPSPTPTPTPSVTESSTPTPTPTVSETSTPTPTPSSSPSESSAPVTSVVSNSGSNSSVISKVVTPIAIQSSGVAILKTPGKNGDLTWKKAQDVPTINSEWKLKRNNLANNGNFLETSVSNSSIKVITKGDAFTLRFITGKNRGKIQINVDGKKLATFSTTSNKSKIKVKSWIGIGTGKHTIEIIPIINSGQSVGIDAIQVAKAV